MMRVLQHLVCCLASLVATPDVAAEANPIVFNGDERGDFVNGDFGPLGRVSREVKSERSLVGLMAQAFCLIPFRIGGGEGFVASIAIEETMGG